MEKLNKNELMTCSGGNILTAFVTVFNNLTYGLKKLFKLFGGRK